MAPYTLVIGNKNYSSWSLRPWLLMKQSGLAFEEVRVPLYLAGSKETLRKYGPSGKVPVLIDGAVTVWDSLAISEYLAERHPERQLWPADSSAARSGALDQRRDALWVRALALEHEHELPRFFPRPRTHR